ncbi:MAG TPA: DNA-formamidopyrimidine glycosylase family protein [Humibacillus sp.]|nr:DNA-formamidopyrimidine glycosylase family protein [Humibacillus sp.]
MPEGHTIHALAGRLARAFGGRAVQASSPQGRFADEARRLDGEVVQLARAVGKHLFVEFPDETLHVHLGLIGSFPVKPLAGLPPVTPQGALRLRLLNDDFVADLRGPIACELLDDPQVTAIESALGPDPLDPAADSDRAWERIRLRRKTIAELLMDQSVLAGVGNVYRCEVLHRHRINPFTLGTQLKRVTWELLWADLVDLLPLGVAFSQILTVDDQVAEAQLMVADGSAASITRESTGERLGGHFERRFAVYKRTGQACPRCGKTVRDRELAGRRLYWCANCQRRH